MSCLPCIGTQNLLALKAGPFACGALDKSRAEQFVPYVNCFIAFSKTFPTESAVDFVTSCAGNRFLDSGKD